ncbi:multiheme c-type cytochrome [Desulfonema magnum]|uniref:Cytochrome c family protein n=1 Tax=Desulfonema magnum TaxID=45655 RepID=A0A975BVD4_9BACT|nr:cytochrome c3 family protein [Desulfonema magnum]QTA92434.1 Cytochrome c family protein [Desulfonema magnum]
MYKGFLVDKNLTDEDEHFAQGCGFCHKGNENAHNKEDAHKGLIKRPSDDVNVCGECHYEIADRYKTSLHYTTAGLRHGAVARFSDKEAKIFDEKVFQQSCRSCHASCGDCHVKGPKIGVICTGLLKGHKFVRRDEVKTCGFCHGGRVYPEFTGQYGVVQDVHFEKKMMCLDCHKKNEFHGDGNAYTSRRDVKNKPECVTCHPPGKEKSDKAKQAHEKHKDKVSCTACHALSTYKNCYNCHLGKGGKSKAGFILGRNPRNKDEITTLRAVPTVRDTFGKVGIKMEKYDTVPNYYDTMPHVIRKSTERTNNCNMCHLIKMGFLNKSKLIENGSKANEELIYLPKPIKSK